LLAGCLAAAPGLFAQELRLEFMDVGQGDAALIVTHKSSRILIDAGPRPEPLLRYLRDGGHDTLDLVIASHAHADHIGGMEAVLRSVQVRFYLDNGAPHPTATYRRTLRAVELSGAQYLRATARTITAGSARVRIMPPPPGLEGQNNRSVGALLEFGAFRALFTGDSELAELEWWLRHDSVPAVAVVKVAHHGSWNGTTAAWVAATRPLVAVVSVGAGNSYGHPSQRALALWRDAGARVLRTDVEGTITVRARPDGSFTVTSPAGTALEIPAPEPPAPAGTSRQPAPAPRRQSRDR
jgi:beta-lactamase superfamily II metal-dependent hydrolase